MYDGQRERRRFINEGAENFEPRDLFGLLLFYAIPRKDTNAAARLLLERFGSIPGAGAPPVPTQGCRLTRRSDSFRVRPVWATTCR